MADRYWVAGDGNWSDTAHWSTSSGGAPGALAPTASDNVIFDTNSSVADAAYMVTIDASAVCLDFTMDGPGAGNNITWAGSSSLGISGSMNLIGGSTDITVTYTGLITFNATTTSKTITLNGVALSSSITFNGVGGEWTLQSDVSCNNMTLTKGSLITNGKTVNIGNFSSDNSNVRSLNLGASLINVTGGVSTSGARDWDIDNTTNLTFNAGTSTITIQPVSPSTTGDLRAGSGLTFYNVIFEIASGRETIIFGSNTFNNLTIQGLSGGVGTVTFPAGSAQIVNGTFSANGISCSSLLILRSSTAGHKYTISAPNAVSLSYLSVSDSIASGVIGLFTTSGTDGLNNIYWFFTSACGQAATPALSNCSDGLDVVMVVDRSGSINSTEMNGLKAACRDLVGTLNPLSAASHLGIVSFSTLATLDVVLGNDVKSLNTVIGSTPFVSDGFGSSGLGQTNLPAAIDTAVAEFASVRDRDDNNFPNFMVIMTDGETNVPDNVTSRTLAETAIAAAETAGIRTFVIAIGLSSNPSGLSPTDEDWLRDSIATNPGDFFSIADFDELTDTLVDLFACQVSGGSLPNYNSSLITAVTHVQQGLSAPKFIIAGQGGAASNSYKLFKKDTAHTFTLWRSPVYNIGKDFDVMSIKFNIIGGVGSNKTIIPVLYFDSERTTSVGNTIDTTNYPNSEKLIELTSKNFGNTTHGKHSFFLELQFTGTALAVVSTPINIEVEVNEN